MNRDDDYDRFSRGETDVHGQPTSPVVLPPVLNGTAESKLVLLPPPNEPLAVARQFAEEEFTEPGTKLSLRHWRGGWWRWLGAHWHEVEDRHVQRLAYLYAEHAVYLDLKKGMPEPWSPTRYKVADLLAALAALSHTDTTVTMPAWVPSQPGAAARDFVSVQNGLLHVATEKLRAHDPALFNSVSVPFDYDRDAADPTKWVAFLDELWPDDPDSVKALRQFFGYVISGRTDLQKILLLVGPTRAGKGVIARVIKSLIGSGNCAGPTLASMATNFGLQPLIGKSLAIVSDARLAGGNAHQVVERLLSVSGEDMLTVDRKYRDPWTGTLPTRFMVVSNELPRFGDASGAIANRFVVLDLERSFLGKENTRLTSELLVELPGILNWALGGLRDLQKEGCFAQPAASVDAVVALQDLVSPVAAFVRDKCSRGVYEVRTDELFAAWRLWADDHGHRPGSSASFGRDLRAVVPGLKVRRPSEEDGARHRFYAGLQLGSPTT